MSGVTWDRVMPGQTAIRPPPGTRVAVGQHVSIESDSPTPSSARIGGESLQPASTGVGPFVQRDYWAVIDECRSTPSELMTFVRDRFVELPPPSLVVFERCDGDGT